MSNPLPPRIALPEGDDERIINAARRVAQAGIARPVFLQPPAADATASERVNGWAEILPVNTTAEDATLLKESYLPKKTLSDDEVQTLLRDPLHRAALALKSGAVDGVVAGAATATATVVRVALKIIGLQAGIKTLSSFFLMRFAGDAAGATGKTLLLADCALVIEPTPEQLVDIAVASAASARTFLDVSPHIALLSFSTAGSSAHPQAQKIKAVAETLRQRHPHLSVIGEVQADAALVPEIAHRKGVSAETAANVLIFPDLNAGNIAYKLIQQTSDCIAIGPILQGLAQPFNDLSRGATVADIEQVITLTARQARTT